MHTIGEGKVPPSILDQTSSHSSLMTVRQHVVATKHELLKCYALRKQGRCRYFIIFRASIFATVLSGKMSRKKHVINTRTYFVASATNAVLLENIDF